MKKTLFYWVTFQKVFNEHVSVGGTCIKTHPLQFARDWNKDADMYGRITPLSWQELTYDEFRRFNDDWA